MDVQDISMPEIFQDCEDFVGRGADLQRLLQILGTSGGHVANLSGKSRSSHQHSLLQADVWSSCMGRMGLARVH